MLPTPSSDEGTDADMVTAETPCTSKSLVALEVENDMLREENDKLTKNNWRNRNKPFPSDKFLPALTEFNILLDCLMLPLSCFWKRVVSKFELQYHSDWAVQMMPLVINCS